MTTPITSPLVDFQTQVYIETLRAIIYNYEQKFKVRMYANGDYESLDELRAVPMSNIYHETGTVTKICKECHKTFSFSKEEAIWLQDKGLGIFKRCPDCRRERRANNGK